MLTTIIIFIIILSLLVFAHELGHFWTARRFGVKAEEFGFGFPPRIFGLRKVEGKKLEKVGEVEQKEVVVSDLQVDGTEVVSAKETDTITEIDRAVAFKKWRVIWGGGEPKPVREGKGGTIYSINWLPLGGFVKIKGEQGENRDEPDSFSFQKIWKRIVIVSAGVTMNLALAAVLISIGFMLGLPQVVEDLPSGARVEDRNIQVMQVLENSPAEKSGLQMGDIILGINGERFITYEELQAFVAGQVGNELIYEIKRGVNILEFHATPEVLAETKKGGIGIAVAEMGIVSFPWYQAIWEGIKTTLYLTWFIIVAILGLIKSLIVGQGVSADIAGPVGIAVLTGQVAQLGFIYILQFAAILSINLAIINFLPFPALDGGRIIFLFIEKICGRAVPEKVEAMVHNIGFALLMVLIVLVTYRDVLKLFR